MDRFKGFVPGKKDSVTKRAATALVWLLKRTTDTTKAFVDWRELYAVATGRKTASVDPTEVKEQLRKRGQQVKVFMREMGYGWECHPADRSLIRACYHGEDSGNCVLRYMRRADRANENVVTWADKTMGDVKAIIRTKHNREMLDAVQTGVSKIRSLTAWMNAAEVISGPAKDDGRRPAKKAA